MWPKLEVEVFVIICFMIIRNVARWKQLLADWEWMISSCEICGHSSLGWGPAERLWLSSALTSPGQTSPQLSSSTTRTIRPSEANNWITQSRVKFHRQNCSLCSPRWMLGQCLIRLSITISPGRQVRRGEKVTQSAWEMGELCFDFSTSYLTLQSSLWNTNMQNFLFIPSVSEEGNIQILNITWLSIKVHYYCLSIFPSDFLCLFDPRDVLCNLWVKLCL